MKAVIFDMDGVIVDTMDLHFEASSRAFTEHGLNVSKQELKKFDTLRTRDVLKHFFAGKSDKEAHEISQKREKFLFENTSGIKAIPGFKDFFSKVKGKYKIGLYSASRLSFIEHILSKVGEKDFFDVVLSAESVSKGKPDPEGYLKVAELLKVQPGECVVIEDSIYGVMAAKAAGMKCVAVTTTYEKNFLLDADLIVDSLSDLSIPVLEGLFNA